MVITVTNNKGGVSKTTLAVNLAYCYAQKGQRVLLVDVDAQRNATKNFNIADVKQGEISLYNLFLNEIKKMLKQKTPLEFKKAIVRTEYGVDVLRGDQRLSSIPTWMLDNISQFKSITETQRHWEYEFPFFLQNILRGIKEKYDKIIIDTPPAFEYHTKGALLASDYYLTPIELGEYEFDGLENLFALIRDFKQKFKKNIEMLGIVITRYEGGSKGARFTVERDLEEQLKEHPLLGDYVFKTFLYRCTAVREAATEKVPAAHRDRYRKPQPKRSVWETYNNLIEEVDLWAAKRA